MTGKRSGTGTSSATRANPSSTMRPPLTSCMDALLERLEAYALDRVDEDLAGALAQFHVGRDDVLDYVDDLAGRQRRAEQGAELGVLISAAADRHLVIFLPVLLDAENADVADMVMAAGV